MVTMAIDAYVNSRDTLRQIAAASKVVEVGTSSMTAEERKRFKNVVPRREEATTTTATTMEEEQEEEGDDPMTVEWTKWPRSGHLESGRTISARPEESA